jgi:hypothetical protein
MQLSFSTRGGILVVGAQFDIPGFYKFWEATTAAVNAVIADDAPEPEDDGATEPEDS